MQLVRHGKTIVLTPKMNDCKTPFPEAASRLILSKKNFQQIQLQIHRGNAQQGAFTPIKLAKQSC